MSPRGKIPPPAGYFVDALEGITGEEIPGHIRTAIAGARSTKDIPDGVFLPLQDWCVNNAPCHWMTGLSMMDSADLIVKGAAENANIDLEPFE